MGKTELSEGEEKARQYGLKTELALLPTLIVGIAAGIAFGIFTGRSGSAFVVGVASLWTSIGLLSDFTNSKIFKRGTQLFVKIVDIKKYEDWCEVTYEFKYEGQTIRKVMPNYMEHVAYGKTYEATYNPKKDLLYVEDGMTNDTKIIYISGLCIYAFAGFIYLLGQ